MRNILYKYRIAFAVIFVAIIYFIAAKFLRTYEFDVWDQQTWGYTALFDNFFAVYTRNIGGSGTSVYGPLACIEIYFESIFSAAFDLYLLNKDVVYSVLSDSYKFIRKFHLAIVHFSFSLFLYYKILSKQAKDERSMYKGFLIWLINPVSLLVGTVWGQLDEVLVILQLLTLYFLSEKKFILSAVLLAMVVLYKVQGIIVLPTYMFGIFALTMEENRFVLNIELLKKFYRKAAYVLSVTVIIFGCVVIPYLLYDPRGIVRLYTQLRIFQNVQMGAFNLWMLIFGDITSVSDNIKSSLFGLSYHALGSLFFIVFSFNIFIVAFTKSIRKAWKFSLSSLLELHFVIYATFFIFLTEVHERFVVYFYLPYLLFFVVRYVKGKTRLVDYLIYIILTVICSLNLIYVLYKGDIRASFNLEDIDSIVKFFSFVLILVYVGCLVLFRRRSWKE